MKGPVAPKDPTKKRPGIYFMLEDTVYTAHEMNGRYAEMIFLENRVAGNLKLICPELPDELAGKLQSSQEFFRIVHSIGVTAEAEEDENREAVITCALQHYGKTDRYHSGSTMEMETLCDGAERIYPLTEFENTEENDILGTFFVFSEKPNVKVKLTVKLYLQDGYEVPEPVLDPPVAFDSPEYRTMIERSLFSMGNTHRLRKAMEKAERGEDVTIAFIGGSITQGAGAKPIERESYCYRVYRHFCETYATCPEKVHLIKAGLGGTPSELGLVRYEHDVLRDGTVEPDIVFIEFAVNDEGDETKGVCFESLISKVYNQPNMPAVLIVFAVFMNDWNLQDRLSPIGFHYAIPMISVKDAVSPQFPAGPGHVISKRQYFYDIFHPTNDGHHVMADCICNLLEKSLAHIDEEFEWPAEPCMGRPFDRCFSVTRKTADRFADTMTISAGSFTETDTALQYAEMDLDAKGTPQFPENWMRVTGDEPFVIRTTCRNLFLTYKDSGDPNFGTVDVTVDGTFVRDINARLIGWNHVNTFLIINEKENAEHEVRISMKPGEEDKQFTIFAITVSND